MRYIVIPFLSRAHTVKFAENLRNLGIPNEIVNTPKQAGVGCGLAVKISPRFLEVAKRTLSRTSLQSFAGFFLVEAVGGKITVKRI